MTATQKRPSQCQRLYAYVKSHSRGITVVESTVKLSITNPHKRFAEMEGMLPSELAGKMPTDCERPIRIVHGWVTPANAPRYMRYRLA